MVIMVIMVKNVLTDVLGDFHACTDLKMFWSSGAEVNLVVCTINDNVIQMIGCIFYRVSKMFDTIQFFCL